MKTPQEPLPVLYSTFHGERDEYGATFRDLKSATGYPGPRMLECADKRIVPYVPATLIWRYIAELRFRSEDCQHTGAAMEIDAIIGDLQDMLAELEPQPVEASP